MSVTFLEEVSRFTRLVCEMSRRSWINTQRYSTHSSDHRPLIVLFRTLEANSIQHSQVGGGSRAKHMRHQHPNQEDSIL